MTGWSYLATVMDGYSRKIVGWSVAESMHATIVLDVMDMAIKRERPSKGLIVHSDRGIQYACEDYRDLVSKTGFIQSISRKGNCWDNAPMESFFDTLKCEHVFPTIFQDVEDARQSIFEWVEAFYNRERIHSSLGYKTPLVFMRLLCQKQTRVCVRFWWGSSVFIKNQAVMLKQNL